MATSIVFSRVSSNQLPDNGPQKGIHRCNVREVVSMSAEELKDIQHRYRMFVARLLIEKFSELASLNPLLASKIELKHEHSDVTANKSEIMTLPILKLRMGSCTTPGCHIVNFPVFYRVLLANICFDGCNAIWEEFAFFSYQTCENISRICENRLLFLRRVLSSM